MRCVLPEVKITSASCFQYLYLKKQRLPNAATSGLAFSLLNYMLRSAHTKFPGNGTSFISNFYFLFFIGPV